MTKSTSNLSKACLLLALSGLVISGCEKKPDNRTPGKPVADYAPSDTSTKVAPAVADTLRTDTVKPVEPEIPVVSVKETKDLIEYMDSSADASKYASGILHRMAYDSPEYTKKLLNSQYSHFIIVDKQAMELALFDRYGREELRYGIACGKNFGTKDSKGDCRTPEGFFSAEGIYDSTDWLYTDDNGVTSKKKGQFGPRFVRLRIPGTSAIGIHGTCAPGSIGRRTSHGCIRVKNDNILELVKHVNIGMPIIVSPSNRDMSVNKSEGRYIAQVTINPGSKRKSQEEIKKEKERAQKIREEIEAKEKEAEEKAQEASGLSPQETIETTSPESSPETSPDPPAEAQE